MRTEGFFALYRGFVPNFVRLCPWNIVVSFLLNRDHVMSRCTYIHELVFISQSVSPHSKMTTYCFIEIGNFLFFFWIFYHSLVEYFLLCWRSINMHQLILDETILLLNNFAMHKIYFYFVLCARVQYSNFWTYNFFIYSKAPGNKEIPTFRYDTFEMENWIIQRAITLENNNLKWSCLSVFVTLWKDGSLSFVMIYQS